MRAEDPGLAKWQDRLERPWGVIGAGCHPNRDTLGLLGASALDVDEFRRDKMPKARRSCGPIVVGAATKASRERSSGRLRPLTNGNHPATQMNSIRAQAYGRVMETIRADEVTKLQDDEADRIREAADTLLFCDDLEAAPGRPGGAGGHHRPGPRPRRERPLDARERGPAARRPRRLRALGRRADLKV